MSWGRSLFRTIVLLWLIFAAMVSFGWLWVSSGRRLSRTDRARWLHNQCKHGLPLLGVNVVVKGPLPASGLIVSNHLSYLDILVFSAALPCIFVSKYEVRSWPLLGALARLGGTIFVKRERRSETPVVRGQMEETLLEGVPVVLFPEGTSSDGSSVLPFRTALFDPAVRLNLQVTPACIAYSLEQGIAATDVYYWGEMSLVPHLLKLLSNPKVSARIRISLRPGTYQDRKQAATRTWAEVVSLAGEQA